MGGVEKIGLLLLLVRPVLDVPQGQLDSDGDVLDAGDIEIPPFKQGLSHEFGHMPLSKNGKDLLSAVLRLLSLAAGRDGVLVDLLA
jgi:hypothetical protein